MSITYHEFGGRSDVLTVKLAGCVVGRIQPAPGGYQYLPKAGGRGEVLPSIAAVKRSLEAS